MKSSSRGNAGDAQIRNDSSDISAACSRSCAGGRMITPSACGLAAPTVRSPVVDMIDVRLRTRSGCRSATSCAIIPPREMPTTCALGRSSASSSPAASSAMSMSEYDADDRSPPNAAIRFGIGASCRCVDSPASRLS